MGMITPTYGELAFALRSIELLDQVKDYDARNKLVLHAVLIATVLGLPAGFHWDDRLDDDLDGFRIVAYIALPTGQVSWHMPEFPDLWDGHTTEQKYQRIHAFANEAGYRCAGSGQLFERRCPGCPDCTLPCGCDPKGAVACEHEQRGRAIIQQAAGQLGVEL